MLALESNLGRSFSSFPVGQNIEYRRLIKLGMTWGDGGGGRITRRYRSSPFGPLPAATFSRWRSSRTLVEASHPSP
ncbi:hypothetical protein BN1007_70373 [Klebsiella variicola]|nr:hypothetical protein BN1007_70373 [Klebsiella variicola]